MLRGDHDGISTNEDLIDFFGQLPNGDRQFVILPNTAHSIGSANNRHMVWYVMQAFLTMRRRWRRNETRFVGLNGDGRAKCPAISFRRDRTDAGPTPVIAELDPAIPITWHGSALS